MTLTPPPFILPKERAIIIIGNYGSGKSEVAVNWAITLREWGVSPVAIADLDVVNPYFRSREAFVVMESHGIRVVAPKGGHFYADLPIILPEIKGLFQHPSGTAIFDVGGEDAGARILRSFDGFIPDYELLMVLNANRPFTNTLVSTQKMIRMLENASGLHITGFIGNTHLMEETDARIVIQGYEFLKEISEATGIPIRFITARKSLYDHVLAHCPGVHVLPLTRILNPPWNESARVVAAGTGPSIRI
ncbi:cobalamin biosynthesis protein CbiA [Myxococcota bacterium]|nr:cobalamin biosynthesis protein CbiA [Myxococcota bacterium]MBU1534607.1 cobalamin biosynthesis protein CbiA [Myxococcota bacterium]